MVNKDLDSQINKKIFGWKEVQAPKYDYYGKLPNQGKVLAPPDLDLEDYRMWPNVGIVPYTYFCNQGYASKIEEAMKVADRLAKRGEQLTLESRKDKTGTIIFVATFTKTNKKNSVTRTSKSKSAAMAICLAALKDR